MLNRTDSTDGKIVLIQGDVMEALLALPPSSVHCVMTSPPYFALRSYLPKDDPLKPLEIGSEPTPDAFIATMVRVFREVRRVLRDDGLCFINLGDSYGASGGECEYGSSDGFVGRGPSAPRYRDRETNGQLLNIPHRVAEALRADGWIWRQTICWHKKSPMPESVSGWRWMRCRVKTKACWGPDNPHPSTTPDGVNYERTPGTNVATWSPCPGCPKCAPNGGYVLRRGSGRCTTAHEYVFILAKSSRYFWDSEGCKEEATGGAKGSRFDAGKTAARDGGDRTAPGYRDAEGRNPRSVWTLSSEPTSVRHFATFPSELVRRCLVAGVSAKGCCPTCGAPWAPVIESERVPTRPGTDTKLKTISVPHGWATGTKAEGCMSHGSTAAWQTDEGRAEIGNRDPERHVAVTRCMGYRQTCDCPTHDPTGCTVLDIFGGIGTVAQTARHLGHKSISIDLNPAYIEIAKTRIIEPPRWFLRQQNAARPRRPRKAP